jgi:hypothetical protein
LPLRLVTDDPEGIRPLRPLSDLGQKPAFAAAGIADGDSGCHITVIARGDDRAQQSELVDPANERAHVPKRTTKGRSGQQYTMAAVAVARFARRIVRRPA